MAVALRSLGVLGSEAVASLRGLETWLFVVALAAMGTGVRLAELCRVGIRPIGVGLAAWLLVSAVAAAGVVVSH